MRLPFTEATLHFKDVKTEEIVIIKSQIGPCKLSTRAHTHELTYPMFCRCTHGAATCVDNLVMSIVLSLYLNRQRFIHTVIIAQFI